MFLNLTLNLDENHPLLQWASKQTNPYIATGHIGTHLDIYNHSHIPINYFKNTLAVIDIPHKKNIDLNDLELDKIKNKQFILFHTHHMEKYEYGTDLYFNNHPELSDKLIDYLCQLDIHFIGIDAPGIKNGKKHEITDRKCENHNIYVIENINNTSQINDSFHTIYVNWENNPHKTGYPCFLIAESEDRNNENT